MINITRALKSERVLKSLTGLSIEKFKELVIYFDTILDLTEDLENVSVIKHHMKFLWSFQV